MGFREIGVQFQRRARGRKGRLPGTRHRNRSKLTENYVGARGTCVRACVPGIEGHGTFECLQCPARRIGAVGHQLCPAAKVGLLCIGIRLPWRVEAIPFVGRDNRVDCPGDLAAQARLEGVAVSGHPFDGSRPDRPGHAGLHNTSIHARPKE